MQGEWWQVYDLKNLKPVGPAFTAPANLGNPHILSPNGAHLVNRTKDTHGTIDVWDCKTGKLARSIEVTDGSENRYAAPADFAGPNRLLTKCHETLFPLAEAQTLYQVWDLATCLDLGDRPALQWTPDGERWLMVGHLLMDARTGAVTGRIGTEPRSGAIWTVQRRNFVGPNFVTEVVEHGFDRKLTYVGVPTRDQTLGSTP